MFIPIEVKFHNQESQPINIFTNGKSWKAQGPHMDNSSISVVT